jgi:DNA polymerase-3 subunit gamma/tau
MVVRAGAGSVRDALSVLDQLIGGSGADGVTHAYAASLLGYTDAALLDDVVDALAAGDSASVFELVDRVLESGIDPRRFVADLLERLRDLIIVQAVPDAGAKGLLHAPEDQLARMLGQAGRFGPAELARAADVVNTGLTEMRGATAPRLQLELICARVLLPAADADGERGMRARLDRLERRFAISGEPEVARPAAPKAPAAAKAAEPPSEARRAEPAESTEPAPPAAPPAPPVPSAAEADAAPDGGLDLHAVRRMWPEILDQVKVKRRVTWMLLFDKVQVLGLDGRSLTLGFPDAGSVKGFTAGGHDEVLHQAVIDIVGADWRIDPVHQPGGPGGTPVLASPPEEPPVESAATPTLEPKLEPKPEQSAPAPRDPPRVRAAGPVSPPPPVVVLPPDEPADDDDDAADSDLAGAELVARELGGRVIGEFGAGQP